MPFPPPRDHSITPQAAEALMRRYRQSASPGAHLGFMFPREVFERILAQSGCAGIRAYEGRSKENGRETILVGVDENGDDMMTGVLADTSFPCPPYCGGGPG